MKSVTLIIMLIFSMTVFSQQTTPPPAVNTDYLKKSKTQKTIGWVLAGGGTVTALVSLTSFNFLNIFRSMFGDEEGDDNIKRGETAFYIGSLAALSSIPFFIASSKNKKKAASLSFKTQRIPGLQQRNFVYHSYPALSLKLLIK